ncbi:MAG: hypothetical protein WCP97_07080 [bacterium]
MKKANFRSFVISVLSVLVLSLISVNPMHAATYGKRVYKYIGSPLLWVQSNVDFYYTGMAITSAYPYQQSGCIYPNSVSNSGVSTVTNTSTQKRYDFKYFVGVGPWQGMNIYNRTVIYRITVNKDGSYSGQAM